MGDDANKTSKVSPATVPTREQVTERQLLTLHGIIQNLSPFLLGPRPSFFSQFEDSLPPKLDGGVAASATATFMHVCSRIDSILEDKSRWDVESHDKLYASIEKVQQAQIDYLNAQSEGAKILQRPSVQFHPTVANDGKAFVAFYGDISRAGYAIIGVGYTPEEALQSFDAAFKKTPQEQIVMAAESLDQRKSKTKPKKNTSNEVDTN